MSLGLLTMEADENYLQQEGYESEEDLGEEADEETELKAKVRCRVYSPALALPSHADPTISLGFAHFFAFDNHIHFFSFIIGLLDAPGTILAPHPELRPRCTAFVGHVGVRQTRSGEHLCTARGAHNRRATTGAV